MKEYTLTFGQRYARDTHPRFAAAHPDGYVTIVAPDWSSARHLAFCRYGGSWAALYDSDNFPDRDELHPLGELDRLFSLEEVSL